MQDFLKGRKRILIILSLVLVAGALWFFFLGDDSTDDIVFVVKRDQLTMSVTTSGELEAKNSVPIMGPSDLRKLRIWQIKIDDLIEEGSIVKKGDYVGALSKSEVLDKLQEQESALLKAESQIIQTRLDTTIELSQARNEIKNLKYNVKEKEIVVEQSIYEPPATIRQVKNDLERTKKSLKDMLANYDLKVRKNRAKMNEVILNHQLAQRKITQIQEVLTKLTIIAPENGMLTYQRDWDGTKYKVGSMIGAWSPVVANLPDLSSMLSKTYVNEVDISRVKKGQKVNIMLDAFPDMKLTGKVESISNIGQQNPNSDGKVFEVTVLLDVENKELRPAMTTSNTIIQGVVDSTLVIPLEALQTEGDSVNYVFSKRGFGIKKQQIQIGQSNLDFCEVLQGLKEGDEVLLNIPENSDELSIDELK